MCWIVMMHKLNAEVSKVDVKVSAFWTSLGIRMYHPATSLLWLLVYFLKKK